MLFSHRVHWMEGDLNVVVLPVLHKALTVAALFDPGKVRVYFVMNVVAVGEIFLRGLLLFLSVSFHQWPSFILLTGQKVIT